jgi:hypothetical protein
MAALACAEPADPALSQSRHYAARATPLVGVSQ